MSYLRQLRHPPVVLYCASPPLSLEVGIPPGLKCRQRASAGGQAAEGGVVAALEVVEF